MFGRATTTSGHANIGSARRSCEGYPRGQVGTCMRNYFSHKGVKCMPRAKTCHTKKRGGKRGKKK